MKKNILAVALSALCVFSAGCGNTLTVTYSDNWNSGVKPSIISSEDFTYSVNYSDNFSEGDYSYKKTTGDNVIDYVFFEGTFNVKLSTFNASKSLPCGDSDVIDTLLLRSDQLIYRIQTSLTLPLKFRENSSKQYIDVVDTVTSDCYFCKIEDNFAPILSTGTNVSTLFYSGQVNTANRSKYDYEIKYGMESYDCTVNQYDLSTGEITDTVSRIYNYKFGEVIDNNSLLFLTRNLSNMTSGASKTVNTVAPSYGEYMGIRIGFASLSSGNFDLTLNGTRKSGEEQLSVYSITLQNTQNCSSSYFTGKPHLVYIQSSLNTITSSKSVMMQFVEPLTVYGSYKSLGALVYKIKTANFN